MEPSGRLELLEGQEQKTTNLIKNALKGYHTVWGKIQHLVRGGRGNIRFLGQVLGCAKAAQCAQPSATRVGTKISQSTQNKLAILAMNPWRIQLSISHLCDCFGSLHSLKG